MSDFFPLRFLYFNAICFILCSVDYRPTICTYQKNELNRHDGRALAVVNRTHDIQIRSAVVSGPKNGRKEDTMISWKI